MWKFCEFEPWTCKNGIKCFSKFLMNLTCQNVGVVFEMSMHVDINEIMRRFWRFRRCRHFCRQKLNRPTETVVRRKHFSSHQKSFCSFFLFQLKKSNKIVVVVVVIVVVVVVHSFFISKHFFAYFSPSSSLSVSLTFHALITFRDLPLISSLSSNLHKSFYFSSSFPPPPCLYCFFETTHKKFCLLGKRLPPSTREKKSCCYQ